MNKNKKIALIISVALVSIILLIGVTYALNYTQTGTNQELILGDIYMHYNEISGLTITDAVPGNNYSDYFEFTISGKNTYTKKDIYYDFILNRGDLPTGKVEENRIPDKYLKFKLVSVVNNQETIIFQDETYESLNNQRIHAETIEKNTEDEVNRTYRLYIAIDNSLLIGNTSDAIFTFDEFENAFGSVKVNVTGDFSEKNTYKYEDCFETTTKDDGTLKITNYIGVYDASYHWGNNYNPLCTSDVVIPSEIDGVSVTEIAKKSFSGNLLESVEISNGITVIGEQAFSANQITNVIIPNSVTTIGDYAFMENHITDIEIPNSVTKIGKAVLNYNELPYSKAFIYKRTDNDNDGIAEIDTTTIISYGGNNPNVVIPEGVITIAERAFSSKRDSSSTDWQLSSVIIPNSLKILEYEAFYDATIKTFSLPAVEEIASGSLNVQELESVYIGNSIKFIAESPFGTTAESFTKLTIDLPCDDIINLNRADYPWLYNGFSPLPTGDILTLYGENNVVCDVFTIEDFKE